MSESKINSETRIELSLGRMEWNLKKVRELVGVPVMAVVKANAYGHGLVEIGRYLDAQNIDYLMVGKLQEALDLRAAGVKCPIHNFGPLLPTDFELLINQNISQSICNPDIHHLDKKAEKLKKRAGIHVHIDTGMGRMGISYYDALPAIEKISKFKNIKIIGISTTMTEDIDFDKVQLERFMKICLEAEKKGLNLGIKHAASSATLLDLPPSYLNMVRPGIILYGYYPSPRTQEQDSIKLRPILQLKSHVVAVKTLRSGDSVSYHRFYVARKKEKVAILPIGYSDGYPCQAAGQGFVLIGGKRYPIKGDITANHMMVSLRDDDRVAPGDEVVLIGEQEGEIITAYDIAKWAGTSSYKILLSLNPLLPKKSSHDCLADKS